MEKDFNIELVPELLTQAAFAEFGEVIHVDTAKAHFTMNDGRLERYYDLASINVGADTGGRPIFSIARCNEPSALPMPITLLERHPLGSQLFYPLFTDPMIVVVAPSGDKIDPESIRAFYSSGDQGINYYAGTWHLPVVALRPNQTFMIVDRGGSEKNCDVYDFDQRERVQLQPFE